MGLEKKYSYDRFASKGARVGQAVVDILSQEQRPQTVEETLDEFGKDFLNGIRECAEKEKDNHNGKFYIFSLLNKDLHYFGVENVVRHWTIPRRTPPDPALMMIDYKNHIKTLFEVDPQKGEISLLWTLPSYEDCHTIKKNPQAYDPELVKMVLLVLEQVKPAQTPPKKVAG